MHGDAVARRFQMELPLGFERLRKGRSKRCPQQQGQQCGPCESDYIVTTITVIKCMAAVAADRTRCFSKVAKDLESSV